MPTLFTMAGTCALAPNIVIAWLDAPIGIQNLARGDHLKPEYLSINPRGQVPAIRLDDGDVLTEAAAILGWLGSSYGDGVSGNEVVRRKEAEALSYMSSEVHGAYGPHFGPSRFASSASAQSEVKEKAYAKIDAHNRRMDETLRAAGGQWYLGQRSAADAFLYVLTRWIDLTPLKLADYRTLADHRDRMEDDPAVLLALRRQDMKLIRQPVPQT
jgi:glutathione S-transferase